MSKSSDAQRREEWTQLNSRAKRALAPFGRDNDSGGDYWVVDLFPNEKVQMVELHELHMLRPEVIKVLHALLVDFPDWQIEVYVFNPVKSLFIPQDEGVILRHDVIIDTLDRKDLPEQHRFVYDGSQRPPKGFKL